ncbi:MAG TPA: DUF2752 domain-containing protein [Candidatus Sulfotelmatobacter sp.]|nr:DUF2752 domain-containing protein [Candidatus Sulfotelmatobacter sp.]
MKQWIESLDGRRALLAGLTALAAGGLVMLRIFDPATSGVFPPCPLHFFTGLYCPGCGSLRALHALMHGNLQLAWAMNPLTILFLPYLIYGLTSEAVRLWCGCGLPQPMLSPALIRVVFALIVLFGILRNIPAYPMNLLAPGAMLGL